MCSTTDSSVNDAKLEGNTWRKTCSIWKRQQQHLNCNPFSPINDPSYTGISYIYTPISNFVILESRNTGNWSLRYWLCESTSKYHFSPEYVQYSFYCTLERRDTSVKCAGDISHLIPHLEVNTGKCSHRNSNANYIHRMYCSYTPGTGTRGSDRSPLIFFRTDHGKSKVLYCMYINHEEKISPVVQVTHVWFRPGCTRDQVTRYSLPPFASELWLVVERTVCGDA